jgi:hypothetical protein
MAAPASGGALEALGAIVVRFFGNLARRVGGPLTFRLIVQPIVAAYFAIRAGLRDAREGRAAYGWRVFTDPAHRRELLKEGWKDIARVFVAAVIIDFVYQCIELRWFYPGEAATVAAILALLPYLLLRGLANRIAGWRRSEQLS